MSSKREKELKEPDAFVETASRLWTFVHEHIRMIVVVTIVFFGGGALVVALQHYSQGEEESAQSAYYLLEKDLLKLKEDAKPLGDVKQDYGPVIDRYRNFIKTHPKSQAAVIAALEISEILEEGQQFDEALKVIDEVRPAKGMLLYGLSEVRRGHLHAEKGECDQAIKILDGISSAQEYTYLRPFALLKKGVCHQVLGEKDLASTEFKKIDSEFKDKNIGRTGKNYLRLIQSQGQ